VPIEGLEPGHVVLGTRRGDGGLVKAFRAVAQRDLVGPNAATAIAKAS
jgi:hypothetical protein